MPEAVRLCAVIPATDTPLTLDRCLKAIASADEGPDELVVVDSPSNLSAGAARNAGVARSTADVIVFVDADVEVHPDVFVRLRERFSDSDLTAVHGSYDDRPDHPSVVSTFRNLLHHHVHTSNAGRVQSFWTGLGAVRRDAFDAVGGFDTDRYQHPSIEDIELGHRLAAKGGELLLDPEIRGTHLKRWTLRSMLHTDFARRAVPWLTLQLRSRRLSSSLNLGWRHRLSALACGMVVLAALVTNAWLGVASFVLLLALNASFYRVLARRLGILRAPIWISLHFLHHLVALAAVPTALAVHAWSVMAHAPERDLDAEASLRIPPSLASTTGNAPNTISAPSAGS